MIFIERDIYCHRHEAKHYFDELERVGVLHYSPIEAARHVEKIYADVETWWQSHEVQKVKDSFLSRYGRASKDWARELRSALSVITK